MLFISNIVSALLECETDQHNSLIAVLALVKSSRELPKDAHVASMVRGLCTQNTQLLGMLRLCIQDLENDPSTVMDTFKLFVNDFILWFDAAVVVFEKYLACFPIEGNAAILEKPLVHCGCYPAFVDSAVLVLRNPFVVDKLNQCKAQSLSLLQRYAAYTDQVKFNDIGFDQIRACGGSSSVSCFFTLDQIVDRTRDAELYLGSDHVEFLLLDLRASHRDSHTYNALVVVKVPENGPRLVLYPPFRINELSMSLHTDTLSFTTLALEDAPESFSVCGPKSLMRSWFDKLAQIFPTDTKLVSSQDLALDGLGITVSDSSDSDSKSQDSGSGRSTPTQESPTVSYNSRQGSIEIMQKNLSSSGMSSESIKQSRLVVEEGQARDSVRVDYGYADDVDSVVDSLEECEEGFEFVKNKTGNTVSASLPDLVLSPRTEDKAVYRNAAGSAIDINNFGKNYNPSFGSTDELPKETRPGSLSRTRSSSIFSIFRKNKSKETHSSNEAVETKNSKSANGPKETKTATKSKENSKEKKSKEKAEKPSEKPKEPTEKLGKISERPELSIKVPAIGVSMGSQPLSATSSTFGSTLPLPFALPQSTSTHFFKPPALGVNNNNSSTSLLAPEAEEALKIPADLKDTVNSDESVDFYISPTSPKAMKVSRWKQKYGKWEMLTTNESLFVKIVANYVLSKSWMLVFKEEYDEEYGEIIDKPVLMLDIDASAKIRQSSALDLEIHAINSVTTEKMQVIVRCNNGTLFSSIKSNLENIQGIMDPRLPKSTTFDSNQTISSSLMSGQPTPSSTLTSIYTQLQDKNTSGLSKSVTHDELVHEGDCVLLDRARIRLHKQMESYEKIHQLSSWQTITMYSLSVFHSSDSLDKASYHLHLDCQDDDVEEDLRHIKWSFDEERVLEHLEQIGKAAFLVKVEGDIYMLECKGKKEFRRLFELF